MNTQQIEAIRNKTREIFIYLPVKHQQEVKDARQELAVLERDCDHRFPDGTSAIESGPFCNTCKICSWSNL